MSVNYTSWSIFKKTASLIVSTALAVSLSSCASMTKYAKERRMKNFSNSQLEKALQDNQLSYLGPRYNDCDVIVGNIKGIDYYIEDGCCDMINPRPGCGIDNIADNCIIAKGEKIISHKLGKEKADPECTEFYQDIREEVVDYYVDKFINLVDDHPELVHLGDNKSNLTIMIESPDGKEKYTAVDEWWDRTTDSFIVEALGSDGKMRTVLEVGKDSPPEVYEEIKELALYAVLNPKKKQENKPHYFLRFPRR